MRALRIAVIGAGHLGRIARILSTLPGVKLVGVVDPAPEQRRQVAAEFGTLAFVDQADLPSDVDAAVVATPTKYHHAVGMGLLRRGLHLLIEKPLATTTAEADELVDAARRQGVVLQTGHVERFNPILQEIAPQLREPRYIEATRTSDFKFRSTDIGVVLDLMIHDIDLALSLAHSTVRRVEAFGVSVFGKHEDIANARLVLENGCVVSLNASRSSYAATRLLHVWTAGGFASIDLATRTANLARPSAELARREFSLDSLPRERTEHLQKHLFEELLPLEKFAAPAGDQITAELNDFADSIRQGRAPRVSGEQGRHALAIAERILQSIAAHRWDGTADGRQGPFLERPTSIVRPPHWNLPAAQKRREAG